MEEVLSGNQTAFEGNEGQQPIEQSQAQETPSTPQENVFTVKYNKEEVQVPYEQAPDYIQKGLNYDKVSQRAEEYQNHLNRVAQLSGYQTHDELLAAMDEIERQQERQRYEQAGIDPETFNHLLDQHPDIQYARQMKQQQEEQARFQNEANEFFSEFPNVKAEDIQPEVFQLQQQKGLSLLDAYLRVNYKSFSQQAEQQTIQKLQTNALSSPGALGGGEVNHNTSVSNLSSKDFGSLVDQVLRGERKQL